MENFGSLFAFDPFTGIGQSYWKTLKKKKKSCEFSENTAEI